MKFGIRYCNTGRLPGDESVFPLPDPLIWMAYVAAATSRIRLATGVIILPEHNPVLCAKQVA
ncbi:MAG TPA: LLM class flavin-dependent oxidoreductase, partial [Acetobacteraceae bacterium]|nr:LLM class flavin-dependent oxidoreductase [Acetobacteraceae bacterium]